MRHFENPQEIAAGSIMPAYPHFSRHAIDWDALAKRVGTMAMLGVPYGNAVTEAIPMARAQAEEIARDIEATGGPSGLADREMVAIIAYMQRLGRDISSTASRVAP